MHRWAQQPHPVLLGVVGGQRLLVQRLEHCHRPAVCARNEVGAASAGGRKLGRMAALEAGARGLEAVELCSSHVRNLVTGCQTRLRFFKGQTDHVQ